MTKFLAIVKREYIQRVRSKLFIVMTILGPIMLMVFTVVPTLLMGIKTGDTRLGVLDQTSETKVFDAVRNSLLRRGSRDSNPKTQMVESLNANSKERAEQASRGFNGNILVYKLESAGRSNEEIKRELNGKIARDELDGYLIIPPDILQN